MVVSILFRNFLLIVVWLSLLISCQHNHDPFLQIPDIEANVKAPKIPHNYYNVLNYGAIGDSITDNKNAFDKVIAACTYDSGGKIIVPAGIFLINGPLHLKSYTELHLEKGAIIRFGSNPKDYLPVVKTSWEGTFVMNYSPFIYAYGQNDIAITGEGTIDGESSNTWAKWRQLQKPDQLTSRDMNHTRMPIEKRVFGGGHYLRPQLIQFFDCENILIEDVRLEDSPFWCLHLLRSKSVRIRRVKFEAHNVNNDGVDVEYAQYVIIEDVHFNNNDDNVAVKAGRDHDGRSSKNKTQKIVVRNCFFKGLHGIVIGSEMSAGVKDIFVENCGFDGYVKRGIYLKSNRDRGGIIENIYCRNLTFGEVLDCFFVTSNYKNEGKGFPTAIRHIVLEDITCEKASDYAICIDGAIELPIEDITITNFTVKSARKGTSVLNVNNLICNRVFVNNHEVISSKK